MATHFDESDFVDSDYQAAQKTGYLSSAVTGGQGRPPTREELEAKVTETQQRLAELKRAQEELERERAALEEARRRRVELQTSREEMLNHLTRGLGMLEEAEFAARRDAEQMAKTIADFRDALGKIQGIREETWTQENWQVELTRALTTLENARMEWNSARLKWTVLDGAKAGAAARPLSTAANSQIGWENLSLPQLSRLGLALTWPLALIGSLVVILFIIYLLKQ